MIALLRHYFQGNLREIQNSRILRWYGAALACTHILSFIFWTRGGGANKLSSVYESAFQFCWPWFESCRFFSSQSPVFFNAYMAVYFGVSLGCFFLFFYKPGVRGAWWLLFISSMMKAMLSMQDYRFMGNYHYMVYWVMVTYLFIPQKKTTISLLIGLFYFFAGTLKFNAEWLTGLALVKPLEFLPQKLLEWAYAYAVCLEILVIWGLFSRKRLVVAAVLLQLVLFHALSYFVVGYFYPSIMACLVSIFILRLGEPREFSVETESVLPIRTSARALLGVFLLCQMVPLFFKGDSALTSQGRMFSLNMLDATSKCQTGVYLRYKDRVVETSRPPSPVVVRTQCDPLVIFEEARLLCREHGQDKDFLDLDISLVSVRSSGSSYQTLFSYRDFCSRKLRLTWWGGLPE
ncbi:MAG: hypothetical protein AAGB31_05500 [Bdellovibrio sp.]